MSISLKNHEDRITKLEKTSSKPQFNMVYDSKTGIRLSNVTQSNPATWITLTDYNPNVDFYIIETCTDTTLRDNIAIASQQKIISTVGLTYSSSAKRSSNFVEIFSHKDDGGQEMCYIGVHDNKLKAISLDTYGGDGNWLRKIMTLKLYYSFSYNIIYRAMHLLEKFMSQTKGVLAL